MTPETELLREAVALDEVTTEDAPSWYNSDMAIAWVVGYEAAQDAFLAKIDAAEGESVELGTEWQECVKLPIVVHVRKQRPEEMHVSTREGITPVKPDDLIMRGVSGEEYPIGADIFAATYKLLSASGRQDGG